MGDGFQLKSKFLIVTAIQDEAVQGALVRSLTHLSILLKQVDTVLETLDFLNRGLNSKTFLLLPLQLRGESTEIIFNVLLKNKPSQIAGVVLIGEDTTFYQVFSFYLERFRLSGIPFYGLSGLAGLESLPELMKRMMREDFSLPQEWVASPEFQYLKEGQSLKFLHAQKPGKILKSARASLGLTQKQVVDTLKKMDISMTLQRYSRIENDRIDGDQLGATDWYYLCQVLEIHTESISYGYEPVIHLQRVQYAMDQGEYRLPVTQELLKSLKSLRDQFASEAPVQKKRHRR